MTGHGLTRRLAAELVGTAFLLAAVVGSGIMGERLAVGNEALALLGNTAATGAMLVVLILVLGPVSGAHLNPAVSLAMAVDGRLGWAMLPAYVAAQAVGAVAGVAVAHVMFEAPLFAVASQARAGVGQFTGELIATFGLAATILGCLRARPHAVPYAVGLFIAAGYWFTSSTSFANPAVTLARTLTDSFSGIRAGDAPAFVAAQVIGALAAVAAVRWLRDTAPAGQGLARPVPGGR